MLVLSWAQESAGQGAVPVLMQLSCNRGEQGQFFPNSSRERDRRCLGAHCLVEPVTGRHRLVRSPGLTSANLPCGLSGPPLGHLYKEKIGCSEGFLGLVSHPNCLGNRNQGLSPPHPQSGSPGCFCKLLSECCLQLARRERGAHSLPSCSPVASGRAEGGSVKRCRPGQ